MNIESNYSVKYLHGEVLNLLSQLWVCSGWCYWISVLWMIVTLLWYNVNRTTQTGFLLPGNTNYPSSQYLQSSGWDMCHIFICYDFIKDDNIGKTKGDIPTGRMNSVRAFLFPWGQLQQGLSLFLLGILLRCVLGKSAGSWQRGLCFVMLDGPKTSWDSWCRECLVKNETSMGFR